MIGDVTISINKKPQMSKLAPPPSNPRPPQYGHSRTGATGQPTKATTGTTGPTTSHATSSCTAPAARPLCYIPGAGAHALGGGAMGLPLLSRRPASLHYTLPPQPVRAAGWQPAICIRASFEPKRM